MSDVKEFVIRRTLVVPLALLNALTLTLLAVCIVKGQPLAKLVILAGMCIPVMVLLVESALRRVVINGDGVTAYRPLRQRRIDFAAVTGLDSVRVRSRVFLTLSAGDDEFLIISNSYADFPGLLAALMAAVPAETVSEETRLLAQQPPTRQADVFTAWFAVIALAYVLLAQFRG